MARLDIVIPVHNGGQTIGRVLQRLLSLPVSSDWQLGIIVCDDGSTDATADILDGIVDSRLEVLRLPARGGRANACNQGAARAEGDFLLFLDADCEPVDDRYLLSLTRQLSRGVEMVYGPIAGRGNGFWPRYLRRVQMQRANAAAAGDHALAMTSGNLALDRALFQRAGGFNSEYRHYGFEDKDLIARLLTAQPRVIFEPHCVVDHEAGNTVANYCAKMREAGCFTAPLFAERHPGIYRRMAYARLDPGLAGPLRRSLLHVAGRLFTTPLVGLTRLAVGRPGIPWYVQAALLRGAAGLSYLRGCDERRQD